MKGKLWLSTKMKITFIRSWLEPLSPMQLVLRRGMKTLDTVLSMFHNRFSLREALTSPAMISLWKVSSPKVRFVLVRRKYMQKPVSDTFRWHYSLF